MAIRNENQIVDGENIIPSTDPAPALARLEREIRNGVIVDRIDLDAALGSWEYRLIPDTDRARLREQFPPEETS